MNSNWLILAIFFVFNSAAFADEIEQGKALSARCMGCHGADGKSSNQAIPNLAGKDIAYIKDKLNAYRDGSIANPLMNGMAGGLSDAEIESLAAYYNALPN